MKIVNYFWLIISWLVVLSASATNRDVFVSTSGEQFLVNGQPFKMWGIRVASATKDQSMTDHLITQLDDYKAHGINTITVFYMGSSGASYDPFSPDGKRIDKGHQERMEQIIEACREREMVVFVGIFYQNAPFGLRDAEAVRETTRTVTRALTRYHNVVINVANEQNSAGWAKHSALFDFRDPERIIELCRIVREEDGDRVVGGGGYDFEKNKRIGAAPEVRVLLFDTSKFEEESGAWYEQFRAAGIRKPMANVELFGGVTKTWPKGVFPGEARQLYLREIEAAAKHPGLSVFFFSSPWSQGEPMRYDLAGAGTEANPGIRWYFERVRDVTRAGPPQPRNGLVFPGAEWARQTPESQGLNGLTLQRLLEAIPNHGNVAVIRNGYFVATAGDTADPNINIFSATKSLTALIFARLLEQGRVRYDDALPRSDYPGGERATFRQFLSMTSDYDLAPRAPGKHYAYNNTAMRFYGEHMRHRFFPGMDAPDIMQTAFAPLRFQDPITSSHGSSYGAPWAGGQKWSARDLARLGLLVLAGGNWGGGQLIPAEFCDALYQPQIPADATPHSSPGTERTGTDTESNQQRINPEMKDRYSYNWWCNASGWMGAGLPTEITLAQGRGGNYLIVVKPWRVVIAVTNNEYQPERRPSAAAYVRAVQQALKPD